jgi:predicted transcriptional regulator
METTSISALLASRRLTCRALSVRASTPLASVTRAARGDNVRVATAIRIARALGVSVEEAFAHLAPPAVEQPATPETPAQEGGA